MTETILEACCGSLEDVRIAAESGMDRVELNSALFLGGLTPSFGTVRRSLEETAIPIVVMVRPRSGGFAYDDGELRCMVEDIRSFRDLPVAGFVFGVLAADGTLDIDANRRLIGSAEGKPCVFHRAFDVVPDRFKALDQLADLGFVRVLTTGGAPNPLPILDHIASLVAHAGDRITLLLGGVDPEMRQKTMERTGVRELHVARWKCERDPSCAGNPEIHFGGALYPSETAEDRLDGAWLRGFRGSGR